MPAFYLILPGVWYTFVIRPAHSLYGLTAGTHTAACVTHIALNATYVKTDNSYYIIWITWLDGQFMRVYMGITKHTWKGCMPDMTPADATAERYESTTLRCNTKSAVNLCYTAESKVSRPNSPWRKRSVI